MPPNAPDILLSLLEQIHREVQDTNSKVDGMNTRLSEHIAEEEHLLESHTADIKELMTGFPQSDPRSHNEYHQSIIDRNRWLADVFKQTATHIAKYGLIGFFGWLLYVAWQAFLHGPSK